MLLNHQHPADYEDCTRLYLGLKWILGMEYCLKKIDLNNNVQFFGVKRWRKKCGTRFSHMGAELLKTLKLSLMQVQNLFECEFNDHAYVCLDCMKY